MRTADFDIIINLTPNQRAILINALSRYAALRTDMYDYDDIAQLLGLVAATKCGDRYCSYCGELRYERDDH